MEEITVTELAATKLKEIIEGEGETGSALRIAITASPHGGPGYSLTLDGQTGQADMLMHSNGVQIVVDQDSLPLLQGSEIDYMEGLMRSGFVINNPNIESGGCACGGTGGGCGGGGGGGGGACGCGGHH